MIKSRLVYDWPTRLFHWLFAGTFLVAFIIGKTIDEDSAVFPFHMMFGLILGFLVVLRLIWGIVGSRHARILGWPLRPMELVSYFRGILVGDKKRWAGHNPASSWAALLMMLLGLGLGATGILMTSSGDSLKLKDVHEILANAFIILVISHLVGIALHTLRHKEIIGLSMLTGKKENIEESEGISSSQFAFSLFFLALVVSFSINIIQNYDSTNRALNFFGTQLQLSEVEGEMVEDKEEDSD